MGFSKSAPDDILAAHRTAQLAENQMRHLLAARLPVILLLLGCCPGVTADVFGDARSGNTAATIAYLDAGGDVDASDANEATLLHTAVAANQLAVV